MSAPGAAALSNKDFKKFLTPMHPTMKAEPAAAPAAAKPSATPKPAAAAAARSSEPKFASSETKTFKLSRSGLVDPDATSGSGEGGDGEDDGSSASSGKPHKKGGERVLSSRERSFILFQQKQALKATAKTKYRDRTKERNNDANPDYQDSASLAALSAMTPLPAGSASYGSATPLPASVSIEASKYLGGDLAHTHLVKGLDFALLHKVKEELERNEEAKMEMLVAQQIKEKALAAGQSMHAAAASAMEDDLSGLNAAFAVPSSKAKSSAGSIASSSSAAGSSEEKKSLTPAQQAALNMTFHSPLAFAVYNAVFDAAVTLASRATAGPSDLFLPGRMSFDFPLMSATASLVQTQESINALPTTALTSRTDLSAFAQAWNEEHGVASLPAPLHSKLTSIFTRQSREHEERKLKRKMGQSVSGDDGFNVVKTTPEEQKAMAALMASDAAAAKSASTAGDHVSSISGGEAASVVSADAGDDAPMYTVERPPAAADDSDDDDIFAGAGTDYQAKMEDDEGPVYSVARPPASPDSAPAATPSAAVPLFNKSSAEPAVRQLDPRASAMRDESGSDEEDDIFGSAIGGAGDEILGVGGDSGLSSAASIAAAASGKPLSAAMRSRLRAERFAEAEYGDLYAGGAASYGGLDDEDDAEGADGDGEAPAEGSKKAKALEARKAEAEKKHAALLKAGLTPMRGAQLDDLATPMSEKQRAAKFDMEYSQVASILKSRGVKGLDAAAPAVKSRAGGQTPKPQTAEEEERAAKRARILKGFQHK